jgi:membrane protein DedA with SNARE-associated domain
MHAISVYLNQYGYWAVFVGLFFESFGLPLPGETILIAASLMASRGHLNISLIIFCAWVAAVLGDNIGYAIGRFGGRRFLLRHGGWIFLDEQKLKRVEGFFERYGGEIVAVARFFAGLRQFNGLIAGACNMGFRKFFVFNVIGAALWVGFWSASAFLLGSRYEQLADAFKRCEWGVLACFAVVIVVFVWFHLKKHRPN